jgi:hypothetical protein
MAWVFESASAEDAALFRGHGDFDEARDLATGQIRTRQVSDDFGYKVSQAIPNGAST